MQVLKIPMKNGAGEGGQTVDGHVMQGTWNPDRVTLQMCSVVWPVARGLPRCILASPSLGLGGIVGKQQDAVSRR